MALNPNIILQARAPKIDQPIDNFARGLQLKNMLTQQKMQDMALADDQAQRDAFSSAGGNQSQYLANLAKSGNYKAYQSAIKSDADARKSAAEASKVEGDVTNQTVARYRDALSYVNNPQDAAQWIRAQYSDPVASKVLGGMMSEQEALSRIPSDPVLFNQWKQQAGLGATKYIEMNKPTYQTRNLGGTTDTIALPGLGGPAQTVSSMLNTQSPDSIASNATTRRGQNMVDARTRESNGLQRELINEQRALQIDKLQSEKRDRDIGREATIAKGQDAIDLIDKALKHPGREIATGLTSLSPTNYIPGTSGRDFRVLMDQLGGQAFLQAFESLKGGGQITEVEGKKATDAIARLNTAQSEEEFVKGLNDLKSIMSAGLKRAGGAPRSQSQPSNAPRIGTMVDGYRFKGGDPADQANWEKR